MEIWEFNVTPINPRVIGVNWANELENQRVKMVIVLAQRMLSDQVQESVFCHGHVPLKFNRILGKMDRQKSHNWCPPVTVFSVKNLHL